MKNFIAVCAAVALLCCAGCNSDAKRVSQETSSMATKFNELVKAGKTTREQEQAYIDAMASVTYELDRAIRGTKNADTTKNFATIEAKTGINPTGPVKINMNDLKDFKDFEEVGRKMEAVQAIVDAAAEDAHRRDMERESAVAER